MDGFQKRILNIAIVFLLIILLLIGLTLTYSNKHQQWPPMVGLCPDYWEIDGSGNDAKCVNVKNLGTCPAPTGQQHLTMNFNQAPYTGANGSCAKYKWSNTCNVSWDGINYGVGNPCNKDSSSSSSSDSTTSPSLWSKLFG